MNSTIREITIKWEECFVQTISKMVFSHICISIFTGMLYEKEASNIFPHVAPFIVFSGVLMIIFAVLTCLTTDWVTSKPLVGIAGCFSALFGVMTAFCLLFLSGMDYIDLSILVPFLVLGIGMDDSFVLLAAWRRTNVKDPVEKRMSDTYSEATISITITSLTNIICALIGISVPFKVIQTISIYMALSLFMDYVYQVTFFGGCLAISGYREAKNLHAIFFTPVAKSEEAGLLKYLNCFCLSKPKNEKTPTNCCTDKLGKLLTIPKIKFLIMVLYILYLAGGIYCLKYLQESMNAEIAFRKNSHSLKFLSDYAKYYPKYRDRIQIVIDSPVDYSNLAVQSKINELTVQLENSPYMAGPNFTESWLRMYLTFIQSSYSWIALQGYNTSDPEDFIEALRNVFLKFKWAEALNQDIVFSEDGKKILASRFFLLTESTDHPNRELEIFDNMLEITNESDLPVRAFNFQYIFFDVVPLIIPTTKQSLVITSCSVILVFMIFMPNLFCAVSISFTIVSIEVITIGYMSLWDIQLNMFIMILLIFSTGFCTDYSAHVCYAFVNSKGNTSDEKLRDALHAAGYAVIQGCLSTYIGIFTIILAPYAVFNDTFKLFTIIIITSVFHGLFILPVILSLWDNFRSFLFTNHKNKQPTSAKVNDVPNVNSHLFE
ncbi:patched domain-containing protein 3-like isoform X1 [Centruroides vittatus]|uniref:patched domain-containing protein 3-like isoform X1 n=1 Tax=Centruroides vittatus TaxID=120091 RepID=UPI00350EECBD